MTYQFILENIHGYLVNQLDGSSLSVEHFYASLESSIQQTRDQGFIPFLVMTDLIEGRMYDKEINHKFDEFRKLMSTKKIEYIFVCDAECREHSELIDKGDVLYSNFLLLSSYTRSILEKNQEVNDHWNHTSNKGLWTPGKNQSEGIEIARKYPDMMFHFVGNQAGNFKHYWEPLMQDLPPNVKVWGERTDINHFMLASDVFMFNSTWE